MWHVPLEKVVKRLFDLQEAFDRDLERTFSKTFLCGNKYCLNDCRLTVQLTFDCALRARLSSGMTHRPGFCRPPNKTKPGSLTSNAIRLK